jgi:hypothetical protein
MRATLLTITLLIAACAEAPTAKAPAGAPTDHDLDAQRVAEALKHGYKVQNTDGEVLYCRSDFATASHIRKNTVCLTAQQLDDLDQQNQQTLDNPNRPNMTPGPLFPGRN